MTKADRIGSCFVCFGQNVLEKVHLALRDGVGRKPVLHALPQIELTAQNL